MDTRRIVDLVASSVGVAVLAVPLVFTCAALAVTTRQSAIFKQTRYGLNGQPFTIYKLRTIKDGNAPKVERLTRFGSLLRRTGMNELPQMVNILKGDMSLFGPRPFYFEPTLEGWKSRYTVKPGLIGLGSILEKKSGTQFLPERHLVADLEYIRTRNFYLDVTLLFQAVAFVVQARVDPQFHPTKPPLTQGKNCSVPVDGCN